MLKEHEIPYALYRAEQVRALDKLAIEGHGIPGYTLMVRAGEAAFGLLRETWPDARRILVLCGGGNNAGDGFVVGRFAMVMGLEPRLALLGDEQRFSADAHRAMNEYIAAGGHMEPWNTSLLQGADVIVDALLGTGLQRPLEGRWKDVVDAVNASPSPVLSIDIPSGLQADTGVVLGAAIRATHSISFIGLKQGMFTAEGPEHSGQIHFSDLGVSPKVYASQILAAQRLSVHKTGHLLGRRDRSGHKGRYGHVLVVGGDRGYSGAARLCGEAAARSGAGLVSVATHPDHAALINMSRPELMCRGIRQGVELFALLSRASTLAVGPGLGRGDWGRILWMKAMASDKPMVLDADGLNFLAEMPLQRDDWVLTPHPGEAARLLNCSSAEVQADRFQAVREIQRRYGGVVVLKGPGTLVESNGRAVGVCNAGNPGMASGGMGDVLTGIIAGLLAQGLDAVDAARTGVCVHAAAGDLAAATGGERGLLASDLFEPIRRLVNPDV
ncbi:MAG: NAD(P)H-hydrate dehydratase [Chromatiales bacterium]|nr:NAD(P)H-hydrate dehydratase [Chromatiales bacterium]